jgi:hypothetical protein
VVTFDPHDPRDPLHRALKALPAPSAPRTLLPRVMAEVALRQQRRQAGIVPWFSWPAEWRWMSAAAVALLVAAASLVGPGLEVLAGAAFTTASGAIEDRIVAAAPGSAAAAHLASVAWEMVVQPAISFVLMWMVVMCAACAAIGAAFSAALGRAAIGEASQ